MKKRIFASIILVIFTFSFLLYVGNSTVFADKGPTIININGKQFLKDQYGNVLPIWKGKKGILYVREGGNSPGALIPLKKMLDLLTRKSYKKIKSGSFPDVVYVSNPVSYNQEYYGWKNNVLGNSTAGWTIGSGGCFLTSSAMVLATYGLYLNGKPVNPKTLNVWMRDNNGFGGPTGDDLIFSALDNFPGINYTYDCTDYSDAYLAIYYENMPVICFKKNSNSYHFCALIQTDGVASHTNVNVIINPANSNIYSQTGITQTIAKSGLPWWNTPNPRFFVAVKN